MLEVTTWLALAPAILGVIRCFFLQFELSSLEAKLEAKVQNLDERSQINWDFSKLLDAKLSLWTGEKLDG